MIAPCAVLRLTSASQRSYCSALSRCFQVPDGEVLQFGRSQQGMVKDYPQKAANYIVKDGQLFISGKYMYMVRKTMILACHDENMLQIADNYLI